MRRLQVLAVCASASFLMAGSPTCGSSDFVNVATSVGGKVVLTHAGGTGPLVFERTSVSDAWPAKEVRIELSQGLRAEDITGFTVDFASRDSCLTIDQSTCMPDVPSGFACATWRITPRAECTAGRYALHVFANPGASSSAQIQPARLEMTLLSPSLPAYPEVVAIDAAEAVLPSAHAPSDRPQSGHVMAIVGDGATTQLVGWGWNGSGQLGHGVSRAITSTTIADLPEQPWFVDQPALIARADADPGLGWRAVVTTGRKTIAATSDGQVFVRGDNAPSLIKPSAHTLSQWTAVEGLSSITALSGTSWSETSTAGGGAVHEVVVSDFLALAEGGTVFSWSSSTEPTQVMTPEGGPIGEIVAIAGGARNGPDVSLRGLLLDSSGTVHVPKDDRAGLIARRLSAPLGKIVQIAEGERHALLLDQDGVLFAFGDNHDGQLGVDRAASTGISCGGTTCTATGVKPLEGKGAVVAIAAKNNLSYAITADGWVYVWGRPTGGETITTPRTVEGLRLSDPSKAHLFPGFVVGSPAEECHGVRAIELSTGMPTVRELGWLGKPASCPISVSVTVMGDGTGRVISAPTGIDCPQGTTCSARFPAGMPLRFSAETADDVTWSGDCAAGGTSSTMELTPSRDTSCTVTLTKAAQQTTRHLKVIITDNVPGSVASVLLGSICTSVPGMQTECEAEFTNVTQAPLSSYPSLRSAVTTWSGACGVGDGNTGAAATVDLTGTDPTCTVDMHLPAPEVTAETAEVIASSIGASTPMTITPVMSRATMAPLPRDAACNWSYFVGTRSGQRSGCDPLTFGPAASDVNLSPGDHVLVFFEFYVSDSQGTRYGRFAQAVSFSAQ